MRTPLALALLLGLALPAVAQPTFGIKAGVNAANVSFSDEEPFEEAFDKRARLGLVVGVTADLPITPVLSFRPEALYTQKGFAVDVEVASFDGSLTSEIDYLEVPLLLAYRIPAADGLEFSVEAGPTLAYKLRSGTGCSGDFEEECDEDDDVIVDEEDGISDFDLGGAVGLTVGAGPFGVGLRYTNSITSIADDEASDDDFSARNQVFTVTGIFKFGQQ